MDSRFVRMLGRMHSVGSARLADSMVDHLSAAGAVLVEGLAAIVVHEVDRPDVESGLVDRVTTIDVLKASMQPYDRKGAFRLNGKLLHIDGVEADDGYRINFYVVP